MLLLLGIVVYLIMYSLRIWIATFQLHANKFYYKLRCYTGIFIPEKSRNNTREKKYGCYKEKTKVKYSVALVMGDPPWGKRTLTLFRLNCETVYYPFKSV